MALSFLSICSTVYSTMIRIRTIVEAGLYEQWISSLVGRSNHLIVKAQPTNAVCVLHMDNCQGMFLICLFGNSLALLLYLAQWLTSRRCSSKSVKISTELGPWTKRIEVPSRSKMGRNNTVRAFSSSFRSTQVHRPRTLEQTFSDPVNSAISCPRRFFFQRASPLGAVQTGKRHKKPLPGVVPRARVRPPPFSTRSKKLGDGISSFVGDSESFRMRTNRHEREKHSQRNTCPI